MVWRNDDREKGLAAAVDEPEPEECPSAFRDREAGEPGRLPLFPILTRGGKLRVEMALLLAQYPWARSAPFCYAMNFIFQNKRGKERGKGEKQSWLVGWLMYLFAYSSATGEYGDKRICTVYINMRACSVVYKIQEFNSIKKGGGEGGKGESFSSRIYIK